MRRDLLLLAEMIDAGEQAQALIAGVSLAALENDRLRRDALLWNFTVLGEATAQLSGDVKERFPTLPWARPSQLRNRIVHGYWSIDLGILHATASAQLGDFTRQLHRVLAELEADEPGS